MNKVIIIAFFILRASLPVLAQIDVAENAGLHTEVSKETRKKLLNSIDTLLLHINSGMSVFGEIDTLAFNRSFFDSFKDMENAMEKDTIKKPLQLISLYPVTNFKYFISLAFIYQNSLKYIVNIIAVVEGDKIIFSSPLWYITRKWKIAEVGNITYFYPDSINLSRARKFDKTNSRIARNLDLQPERFTFYLCDNHQEAMRLMGFQYDLSSAGNFRDGYGVDNSVIFSTMHNEDFSHDTFHYYSAKFRKHARNSAADEGVAYSWGNAYYTDEQGEMITPKQLMPKLKKYLRQHPEVTPLQLFEQNPPIFGPTGKVRSLLSSLVCDEVERQKGIDGIKVLIDCDKGDENYFRATDGLIGINRSNFNDKLKSLIK
ncbi:MAG TPA: hypothetical protein VGN20_01550 [Mucilaginibacter sp.]|jgi:hypothetical protein